MRKRNVRGRVVVIALAAIGGLVAAGVILAWMPAAGPAVTAVAADGTLPVIDIDAVYDPVRAGETLPSGFRQLLGRDQIEPVYDPVFTSADQVDWPGEMLVLGVAGEESEKAYPVTHLNQHEMVIDHIDGSPILVSW